MSTMRMATGFSAAAALILVFGLTGLTVAQTASPVDTVKARQSHYKQMGGAYKALSDMAKSGTIDPQQATEKAKQLDQLANDLPNWFPPGTGNEQVPDSAAKPEIWTNTADWKKDYGALQAQTANLVKVAAGTDVSAMSAALESTGKACGACHQQFRIKKQ